MGTWTIDMAWDGAEETTTYKVEITDCLVNSEGELFLVGDYTAPSGFQAKGGYFAVKWIQKMEKCS